MRNIASGITEYKPRSKNSHNHQNPHKRGVWCLRYQSATRTAR